MWAGRATFIFMIMSFLTLLQILHRYASTELLPVRSPRRFWKPYKITLPTITRYVGYILLVDLWRPWKYNTARPREITDQLWCISDGDATRRVSPFRPEGPAPPLRCRRFAYGYALGGSVWPCYLVWPQRHGQR